MYGGGHKFYNDDGPSFRLPQNGDFPFDLAKSWPNDFGSSVPVQFLYNLQVSELPDFMKHFRK